MTSTDHGDPADWDAIPAHLGDAIKTAHAEPWPCQHASPSA